MKNQRPQTLDQCSEYAPGLVLYLIDGYGYTAREVAKIYRVKKSLVEKLLIAGREQEQRQLGAAFAEAA